MPKSPPRKLNEPKVRIAASPPLNPAISASCATPTASSVPATSRKQIATAKTAALTAAPAQRKVAMRSACQIT